MSKKIKLTHGEASYLNQIAEIGTEEVHVPNRMPPDKALAYYGAKFYAYWETQMDENLKNKTKILDYLLGRRS